MIDHAAEAIRVIDKCLSGEEDDEKERLRLAVERTLPHVKRTAFDQKCWRCSSSEEISEASWLCRGCILYLTEIVDRDPMLLRNVGLSDLSVDIFAVDDRDEGPLVIAPHWRETERGPDEDRFLEWCDIFRNEGVRLGVSGRHHLEVINDYANLVDQNYETASLLLSVTIGNRIFTRLHFLTSYQLETSTRSYSTNADDFVRLWAKDMFRDLYSEINPLTGRVR